LTGQGRRPDDALAFSWFERAAAGGHPEAQHNLGILLSSGRGCAVDQARASKLFAQAAAQGDGHAMLAMGKR